MLSPKLFAEFKALCESSTHVLTVMRTDLLESEALIAKAELEVKAEPSLQNHIALAFCKAKIASQKAQLAGAEDAHETMMEVLREITPESELAGLTTPAGSP